MDPAPGGRKRGFSQVTSSPSSPSVQRSARQTASQYNRSSQYQHSAQFCTQQCLLGLQQGGQLDDHCPNVMLHRQSGTSSRHLIDTKSLVQQIKQQLDQNLDRNCTPMGGCGASGAPFKITCTAYGYTVVGKGTTSYLWNEVKREADIYRPRSTSYTELGGSVICYLWLGVVNPLKKIRSLGVLHQDLRPENMLWNAELGRILIIDFHSELDSRPTKKRMRLREQFRCGAEKYRRKRPRVGYK
ncbi:hypothetical protein BBP40_002141 [Aspergillus hancockii]|nr:hypothetical protein BBP40_002141 [Aspergillus hancockii]